MTSRVHIIILSLLVATLSLALQCGPKAPPPPPPAVALDAGSRVVGTLCHFLEGITENDTVITICATAEELLTIAGIVAPLLADQNDGGLATRCIVIPETDVCATKRQIGKGIAVVLEQRRSRLRLDDGGAIRFENGGR